MILAIRTRHRRRGFTLIEMAVVLALIGIMAAIATPPWRQYRARMQAYSYAHEMRAELVYIQNRSIDLESECFLRIDGPNQYSIYTIPLASYTSNARPYKRILLTESSIRLNPSTPGQVLVFGARGWVDTGKTTVASGNVKGYSVYTIMVEAPGVVDVPVRTHVNGKVQVQ